MRNSPQALTRGLSPFGIDASAFRQGLLHWYGLHKRDLPWRRTTDPYRIWISEIMLQQTRVAAVLPYYERFLTRFPSVESLADAPEQELLHAWAGLGYYSRARNAQKAARRIVELGRFPSDREGIRALPGIGEYTSAAVASIAFQIKAAALDGNVLRVLSRVTAEPGDIGSTDVRARFRILADKLIDPARPGDFNQAMMELGATICLPSQPQCLLCPVEAQCKALRIGRQSEFPIKAKKVSNGQVEHRLLLIEKGGSLLLWQRPPDSRRMAGFWELPQADQLPGACVCRVVGEFRHTIVNTTYRFEVAEASIEIADSGFSWVAREKINEVPLSTTAKKALACL